ncbi:proton-coupled zinc antiporter SLC30A1 [Microcaecilia unicolor]|uniref:Zinc transporter 1 n=1 Tax=Microcaecilia unicolor TaxID=1415580 RepID=A0A6P7XNE7_9AMPH|nr:zinc transporter 1 [Microcaecilia unicolor]
MACEPNRVRLLCMLSLTFIFFLVEVVVSRITSSLAMLSDSFHMLSDVIALVVALIAVRFAEKTQSTKKNTFGWVRAEVMGALVNAVFLTALCFTIVLEAIERFTEPQVIEKPLVVIGVGVGGLIINLIGLCMFRGSSGGGHGHSHGGSAGGRAHGHGHSHAAAKSHRSRERCAEEGAAICKEETNNLVENGMSTESTQEKGGTPKEHSDHKENGDIIKDSPVVLEETQTQLNMQGVFLHVLGDALGSVIVVVNALVFYYIWRPCPVAGQCINPCVESRCIDQEHKNDTLISVADDALMAGPCWVLYLDPSLCLIMVCILLYTTYPLLKESGLILLQTVPKQIDFHALNEKLIKVDGVEAVHDLHVWQLAGRKIIATAHIKCRDPASYMDVAKRIKGFFHNEGIHATTIQPEFSSVDNGATDFKGSFCELSCRRQCPMMQCCERRHIFRQHSSGSAALERIVESPENKAERTNAEECLEEECVEEECTIAAVVLEEDKDTQQFESSL